MTSRTGFCEREVVFLLGPGRKMCLPVEVCVEILPPGNRSLL